MRFPRPKEAGWTREKQGPKWQGVRACPRSVPSSSPGTAPRPPAPQLGQLIPAKGPVAGLARAEVQAGPRRARQQQHQQHQPQLQHRPRRRHASAPRPAWILDHAPDFRPLDLTRDPRAQATPPGPLGGAQVRHTPEAGPSRCSCPGPARQPPGQNLLPTDQHNLGSHNQTRT